MHTRTFLLSLPPDKFLAWVAVIHKLIAQGFSTRDELEKLIGRLNHVGYIIPFARHFMSCLHQNLAPPWQKHMKQFSTQQKADLHLWIEILNCAHQGISIILLTYRKPDDTCWSDACLTGMGSYNSNGSAWHFDVPVECHGRFTLIVLIMWPASLQSWNIYHPPQTVH